MASKDFPLYPAPQLDPCLHSLGHDPTGPPVPHVAGEQGLGLHPLATVQLLVSFELQTPDRV